MQKILKAITIFSVLVNSAFAENIVIKDCNGNTQLIEAAGTSAKITAELPSIPDNSTAVFTNAATSQVFKKAILGNTISFENISAGEYTLCAEPQKVSFENISVYSAEAAALTTTTGLAIAGAAAGASALAISLGDSDNSSNDESPPVSSFNVADLEPVELQPQPGAAKKPGTKADDNEENCFIGENTEVTPISPFR